jgi:hypothetical protein
MLVQKLPPMGCLLRQVHTFFEDHVLQRKVEMWTASLQKYCQKNRVEKCTKQKLMKAYLGWSIILCLKFHLFLEEIYD